MSHNETEFITEFANTETFILPEILEAVQGWVDSHLKRQ